MVLARSKVAIVDGLWRFEKGSLWEILEVTHNTVTARSMNNGYILVMPGREFVKKFKELK